MSNIAYTLVFGLTADPIHKGHQQVILNSFTYAINNDLAINKFIMVPTYLPNLIANKLQPRTAFKHRYKMCQLLANEVINKFNYPVYVTDIEKQLFIKNKDISYSYETLAAIEGQHKLFVLSADHFAGRWPKFRKWHQWQQIVKDNGLLIHQRPGHGINLSFIQGLRKTSKHIYVVEGLPSIEVSSTEIRTKLNLNKSLKDGLISEEIKNYCSANNLY